MSATPALVPGTRRHEPGAPRAREAGAANPAGEPWDPRPSEADRAPRRLDEWPPDTGEPLVAARFRGVMEALGLDLEDPNLADTPARVARAYRFLFSGLAAGAEPELRSFPNTEGYRRMVALTGIRFHSLCAHHFLPFFGTAHVAYLPKDRLVGLSKLARVVELFARRPQVQERLTEEVAGFLESRLQPAGVMIVVRARHFCMEMRGVRQASARTTTSAVRGAFAAARLRREFLDRIRG